MSTWPESGRQLGREIAYLIGVRKQHQSRLDLLDKLLERRRIPVRSVFGKQIMARPHRRAPASLLQVRRPSCSTLLPATAAGKASSGFGRKLLAGRQRLPRDAVPGARLLLHHDQNAAAHRTRASNFSFSTSFAAASFASPSRISASAWCAAAGKRARSTQRATEQLPIPRQ